MANRIKLLRTEKKMKQVDLADYLNVAQSTVSGWENETYEVDNENLSKMADLFGCSFDYLLGRSAIRNAINLISSNDGVEEILEAFHKRPEMKALFSITKNATKADIEKAMKIIEALKDE